MVKKNTHFKYKGASRKDEKKPRKAKSGFVPFDESSLFKGEDAEDLVRNFLRDSHGFRTGGGGGSSSYFQEENNWW